eukprot:gb/GECG01009012.1/.p1 GENE.gb/GECG01009012.1/~~gb/GECG01009012.1/.p1  ORF type:complete len:160 (+),score=19.80 gb/GECG01009012.1/:1-480(+)
MIRSMIAIFLVGLGPLLSKDRTEIAQVFLQNQLFGAAKLEDDKHTRDDLMIYQYGLIPGQKTWIENYVNIASGQNTFSKVLNFDDLKRLIRGRIQPNTASQEKTKKLEGMLSFVEAGIEEVQHLEQKVKEKRSQIKQFLTSNFSSSSNSSGLLGWIWSS